MNNFIFSKLAGQFQTTPIKADKVEESWCHFERSTSNEDLISSLGVTSNEVNDLLDETTRPHLSLIGSSVLLLFLRAINLNPDSEPEDMVSLRFWFDGQSLITVMNRKIQAVGQVKESLMNNPEAFVDCRDVFVELIEQLLHRIEKHVLKLSDRIERLEEQSESVLVVSQSELHDLRRATSRLWRFMYPQLDTLKKLSAINFDWVDEKLKHSLYDFVGSMSYYNEEILLIKERSEILSNEINSKVTGKVNRNLYIISIISVIFLPLSFITGLLGINVGGIPAAQSESGFLYVSLIIVVLLAVQMLILKWFRWF